VGFKAGLLRFARNDGGGVVRSNNGLLRCARNDADEIDRLMLRKFCHLYFI
jgi:hypothetical protein